MHCRIINQDQDCYQFILITSIYCGTSRKLFIRTIKINKMNQRVGANPAATQAAIQRPRPALQPIIAAGTPAPAVTVPKVNPAPA